MKPCHEAMLKEWEKWLAGKIENPSTRGNYYRAVKDFLEVEELERLKDIRAADVMDYLRSCKGRWRATALCQGLKYLGEYYPSVRCRLPLEKDMKKIVAKKRNRGITPTPIDLEQTMKKINYLRNDRLKLGYLVMVYGGLRVSEVAALQKSDIDTSIGSVVLTVRHGKGDKFGVVRCIDNAYFRRRLMKFLQGYEDNEKPFYAANTMKTYAVKIGIECHDLRRISAQLFRNGLLEKRKENPTVWVSNAKIDRMTMEHLRHERFSTTKKYLYRRKVL